LVSFQHEPRAQGLVASLVGTAAAAICAQKQQIWPSSEWTAFSLTRVVLDSDRTKQRPD